ncbi:MAG: hypothetical protein ACXVZV_15820 [Terriglobales bacterium]
MLPLFRKLLVLLITFPAAAFALDRNAFTFTKYDLEVRVDPEEQALAARGKVTLRNDSDQPQTNVVLQLSSSLDWRMIELNGNALQYLSQPQTTDIDHTGKVTEAVVTLPSAVPPKGTVTLDVGYSGTVPKDATRLTRRDLPSDPAFSSDWDRISPEFTALRGLGHVIWYPMSADPANMSDNTLSAAVAHWHAREAQATLRSRFCWITDEDHSFTVVANGDLEGIGGGNFGGEGNRSGCSTYSFTNLQQTIPTFAIAPFEMLTRPAISIYFLNEHNAQASDYALAAEKVQPQIVEWFGKTSEKVQVVELPEPSDAPFDAGAMSFTPLDTRDKKQVELAMAHQMAHTAFHSPRPWISEGLAHFAQFLVRERQDGRRAAYEYLNTNLAVLIAAEKQNTDNAKSSGDAAQSLVSTTDDIYYRVKAMYVWSMLRDIVGDNALQAALKNYQAAEDKDPTYMQRLVAAQTKRDLEWFFDDWVYRDRGLPNFKIDSAVPRETLNNSYVVAVTVENTGSAGAEIPVTVRSASGEQTIRLMVPARQKVTTRLSVPGKPTEVTVNDGTVPEIDPSNDHMELK